MNPTIGYKRIKKDEPRWTFGTETIGKWHDRKLFDSMIHVKPKAEKKKRKKVPGILQ